MYSVTGEVTSLKSLIFVICIFISCAEAQREVVENEAFSHINSKLKALRKPALKSIQSSDGDVIDCVDIYKQPAFDHPALKNHKIQMKPSYVPEVNDINDKNSSRRTMPQQIWQKSGNCPEGTIPIRRVKKQDLLRSDNLERFGRKVVQVSGGSDKGYTDRTVVINNTIVHLGPYPNISSAMLVGTVYHFFGARGALNIWNPTVGPSDEYTTSQIWLQGGAPDDYNSVEAGWMVNPKLYGDRQTRFFIYWTSDGSHEKGCYDLMCSGFVQTSKDVALGSAITSISSPGFQQYEITVQIAMDNDTGHWWLRVNDKIDVGYWPTDLFNVYLKGGAMLAQWGGEVYSPNIRRSPHTRTQMGSGQFPVDLFNYACYIAHIRVLYGYYTWTYPDYVGTYISEKNCYSAFHYVPGYMKEPTLFFGGPGRNFRCP